VIAHIVKNGIPVMAHIGHSLQNVVHGNAEQAQEHIISHAQQLLADAKAVQDAGAFAVVLKMVPMQLATIITENLHIPTIGMGSGPACDGQVQIFHDLLGLSPLRKHAKQYINVGEMAKTALMQFVDDIQTDAFPTDENSLVLDEAELKILRANGIFEW
jgi:3-methyl-2-oxobutanoate hydroxymethyltransferase